MEENKRKKKKLELAVVRVSLDSIGSQGLDAPVIIRGRRVHGDGSGRRLQMTILSINSYIYIYIDKKKSNYKTYKNYKHLALKKKNPCLSFFFARGYKIINSSATKTKKKGIRSKMF